MKKYVELLRGNNIINVAIVCWFGEQALKIVYNYIRVRKIDLRLCFSSGSMPSSQSALVVGTTTAVARVAGTQSISFGRSLGFATIGMYGAIGGRRAAGEQAKVLNHMMEHWEETTPEMFQNELKELIGHTPMEVASGAMLGLLIGLIM